MNTISIALFTALIVFTVMHFIHKISIKKNNLKIKGLNTFFSSAFYASKNSFYFSDTVNRTEYFKLFYKNKEFESIEGFLEQFHRGKEILEMINNFDENKIEKRNIKEKIISKDKNTVLDLSINYVTCNEKKTVGVGILFYDISEYENATLSINNQFKQTKELLEEFHTLFKLAPYIIWKENNKKISILSNFKSIIGELSQYNSFEELESKTPKKIIECRNYFNINNNPKQYQITKIYKNNTYFCFAHDISFIEVLTTKLNGYLNMLPELIKKLPIATILIDINYKIKFYNNATNRTLGLNPNFLLNEKDIHELLEILKTKFKFKEPEKLKIFREQILTNKKNVIDGVRHYTFTIYNSEKNESSLNFTSIIIEGTGAILTIFITD